MTIFGVRMVVLVVLGALATGCAKTAPVPVPSAPPADKALAVKGNNIFALDLYAKLCDQEGNLFLSPASISTALAMTYAGARGETADEMARTLHFTLAQERLHPALGALLHQIKGPGAKQGYRLSVANALWAQKGHPFLPEFFKAAKDNYAAGLNEVDFIGATEESRQTINAWVQKQTQDKIKDLLQEGVIDTYTRLVLTNAIYFQGDWNSKFEKDRTLAAPFHVNAQEKVTVPLMSQKGMFNYLEDGSFQALELPYAGRDLSMVVFLPKKVEGLADFEKTLTAANLAAWLTKLQHQDEVLVSLPRFKAASQFSLQKTLSALGMPLSFSNRADFSGLDGRKELFLSAVIHKAFVDVNEEGTEAAAATGVVEKKAERSNPVLRADHPFFFLIRDRRSDSILFLGRLVNPQK